MRTASRAHQEFQAPRGKVPRGKRFIVAHAKGFIILAVVIGIGAIAGMSALTSTEGLDPQPSDAAPAQAATEAVTEPEAPISVRGSDGKIFSCPYSALGAIDEADAKIQRRKKTLIRLRLEVKRIERQYPDGTAPDAVIDEYNAAFKRSNDQVSWTNLAVREYNQLLRDDCTPS